MCHPIWKIVLEDDRGAARILLVRSGMTAGFDVEALGPGLPRPSITLGIDGRGELTLNGWFNGKNVRPTLPIGAGETARVGHAVCRVVTAPVLVTDGKKPLRPRPELRAPAASLRFENLDPERIEIVGPAADGSFALDRTRKCTIGIVPEADVQIIGASIGGRRNSKLTFDAARGRWMLDHLGHSCPIYVNGEDIGWHEPVPLRDGDCFEPGGQAGVHIRFYEAG
jgi:hypothetical protein